MKTPTALLVFLFSIGSPVTAQFGDLTEDAQNALIRNCLDEISDLAACTLPNGLNQSNPEDTAFLTGCQDCLETKLELEPTNNANISCAELDRQVLSGVSACGMECRTTGCEEAVEDGFSCIFQQIIDCETGEFIPNDPLTTAPQPENASRCTRQRVRRLSTMKH